jgi:LPXTG-motif cell wall-anchored protein
MAVMVMRPVSARVERAGHILRVVFGVVVSLAMLVAFARSAAAAPNCGGQHAAPQPVPYTCVLPTKVIDGSQVSGVLTADGQIVTVTYQLVTPRPADTPIRIDHHVGISGAGGPESEANGVIPAGATTATLSVVTPCRAGQVDIKIVFVASSQPQGRLGGPWIENGTGCTAPTTTTPSTTTPSTTTPSTTTPSTTTPSTTGTTNSTTTPTSASQTTLRTLPATGSGAEAPIATTTAIAAVILGGLAVIATRRRAANRP